MWGAAITLIVLLLGLILNGYIMWRIAIILNHVLSSLTRLESRMDIKDIIDEQNIMTSLLQKIEELERRQIDNHRAVVEIFKLNPGKNTLMRMGSVLDSASKQQELNGLKRSLDIHQQILARYQQNLDLLKLEKAKKGSSHDVNIENQISSTQDNIKSTQEQIDVMKINIIDLESEINKESP